MYCVSRNLNMNMHLNKKMVHLSNFPGNHLSFNFGEFTYRSVYRSQSNSVKVYASLTRRRRFQFAAYYSPGDCFTNYCLKVLPKWLSF